MKQKICIECHALKSTDNFHKRMLICHSCLEKKIITRPSIKSMSKSTRKISNKNMNSLDYIKQILDVVDRLNYKAIEDLLLFDFTRYSKEELVKLYSLPNLKSILKDLKKYTGEHKEEKDALDLKAVIINELLEMREDISMETIHTCGYGDFLKLSEDELASKYSAVQLEGLLRAVKSAIIDEIFELLKKDSDNHVFQKLEYADFLKLSRNELITKYSVKQLENVFDNIKMTRIKESLKLQEDNSSHAIRTLSYEDLPKLPKNKVAVQLTVESLEDVLKDRKVAMINELLEIREIISIEAVQTRGYRDFLKLSKNELVAKYSAVQIESLLKAVKSAITNEVFKLKEDISIQIIRNLGYADFLKLTEKRLIAKYSVEQLEDIFRNIKSAIIKEILELQKDISSHAIRTLGYEDFLELPENELYPKYSLNHLKDILSNIKDPSIIEDASQEFIDPLLIIKKYENGLNQETKETHKNAKDTDLEVEIWRKHVPEVIKRKMKAWRIVDIQEMYNFCSEYVDTLEGFEKSKVWNFYCELSEIIFSEDKQEEDPSESDIPPDEMEDSIRSLVEMIILPHQEVLELISEKKGKVLFSNIWNEPFSEGLKKEVKDRDSWRCVICESEQNLHVHHKIPRALGGVHHKDNLVTLCGSCHPAIETADVNLAFAKCFSNFKKNKYKKKMNPNHFKKDKSLLREEVENELNDLLFILLNRNEKNLANKLTDTINKLEVIFHE